MNLVPIKDYEHLYSLDLNTNQVYGHKSKKYIKPFLDKDEYFTINISKNCKKKTFKLHRLVYQAHYGTIPDKMQIDHINGIRKDNNISNLRLVNHSENNMNRKISKNNTTGYKCITLTNCNTYRVAIRKNKKKVYDKSFKTLEEAIKNRDIQLKLIHGEFCNLG